MGRYRGGGGRKVRGGWREGKGKRAQREGNLCVSVKRKGGRQSSNDRGREDWVR